MKTYRVCAVETVERFVFYKVEAKSERHAMRELAKEQGCDHEQIDDPGEEIVVKFKPIRAEPAKGEDHGAA